MKLDELFDESNRATYCPEDDTLRLFVGRVPRDQYDALRAAGWRATPKQDCDFAATWTVSRKATAIAYAGIIEDEDAGPAERAADRAERFGGYRDKRLDEATGHADRYDAGPAVHGYQSQARGERAAARHDRQGTRAVDAWDKADYWTSRTAGVISHALHLSSPAVRMGRIKTIEADLRKAEADWKKSTEAAQSRFDSILSIVEHAEGTREKVRAPGDSDFRYELHRIREKEETPEEDKSTPEQIRRAVLVSNFSGYSESEANKRRATEAREGSRPAADIAREWLDGRTRPADWDPETGSEYTRHLKLRLAYEWQMLEAQGGRAAMVEMEVGGWIGNRQIRKVNKSPATGRVVSVTLKIPGDRWGNSKEGSHLRAFNIERLSVDAYRPPSEEDKAALAEVKKGEKAAAPKAAPCPLVNPTDEDAERLQAVWNRREHGQYGNPGKVSRMTQAEYSASSGGTYSHLETVEITGGGERQEGGGYMRKPTFPSVAKVRRYSNSVVILTDKPQKALPAAVWIDPRPAEIEWCKANAEAIYRAARAGWRDTVAAEDTAAFDRARRVGLAYASSATQFGLTDKGREVLGNPVTAKA